MPNDHNNAGMPRISREAIYLVSQVTDGQASEEERARLREILASDDKALAYYIDWFDVHSTLQYDLVRGEIDVMAFLSQPKGISGVNSAREKGSRGWKLPSFALAASVAFVVACFLLMTSSNKSTESGRRAQADSTQGDSVPTELPRFDDMSIQRFREADKQSVAVISEAIDAVWGGDKEHRVGAAVGREIVKLERGVAQIEFLSGANIVLEAPAEVELLSSMRMRCMNGKVRAHVPNQAIGFVVETPSQRVVDLGTEFAVNVWDEGDEIHVLDGEVRLEDPSAKQNEDATSRVLRIGEAMVSDASGESSLVSAKPVAFIGRQRVAELSSRESKDRVTEWRKYRESVSRDANVLLNYDFESGSEWERVLHHDGADHADLLEGAIVGCRWAQGRWSWKRALEFKRTSDRVRLNIPGEYESVTLTCWLRIDGFDRWLSSILLTDGHERGEPHWQFTETGQLLLGVKASDVSEEYLSPSVLRLVDVGRWVHLACVYDGANKRVTHYVDGHSVATLPIVRETPIRFGATEVGNWVSDGFVDHTVRSLNGRIDELVVYKRPLSDDEVKQIYVEGRP